MWRVPSFVDGLKAGLRNFQEKYKHLVDKWEWYDNSGTTPQLISEEGSWK